MLLMRLRHVSGDRRVPTGRVVPGVGGDAQAAMEAFDGRGREADVEDLVDEGVRDRVVVAVDLDVIVDVDASDLPLAVDERRGRQGAQRRAVEALEQLAA